MKLLNEGDYDSYMNMGQMGTEQEKNTNEQDELGTDGTDNVATVVDPKIIILCDIIKRLMTAEINPEEVMDIIQKSDSFEQETKASVLGMLDNHLFENIRKEFKRFL